MTLRRCIVIGNCLSYAMGSALQAYLPDADVKTASWEMPGLVDFVRTAARSCDVIFAQLGLDQNIYPPGLQEALAPYAKRMVRYPRIVFPAFHPDCVYPWHRKGKPIESLLGYHSAIAVEAWRRGMSLDETEDAFNGETFDALGYFDYFEPSVAALAEECRAVGLPVDEFPGKWLGRQFMYTINHPCMFVAWDLAEHLLRQLGERPALLDRERSRIDTLALGPHWPVYPEIAERLGVPGDYFFMQSTGYDYGAEHKVYDLRQFLEASFKILARLDIAEVALSRQKTNDYEQISSSIFDEVLSTSRGRPARARRATHPYALLPPARFWRKAVADTPPDAVDPVGCVPFRITPETKIGTAGSCFAQHIARALDRSGYRYFVTERGPAQLSPEESRQRGYGMFSARYGNIYTARQLLQLIRRAYGEFVPLDQAWQRGDGRLVDPFRPQIEPSGFANIAELEAARRVHFAAVRELCEKTDVFVFTLGLTEAWRRRADGAVFPLVPGAAGGSYDPARYEFINFRATEVIADLTEALVLIRSHNPAVRFILTVSPVPLIATYEEQHVLTATSYSKSVPRVAAEEVARVLGATAYFPSYEIITGNYSRGGYYGDDLREVRPEGVQHVMRLFFKHFAADPAVKEPAQAFTNGARNAVRARTTARIDELFQVACDEEVLGAETPGE